MTRSRWILVLWLLLVVQGAATSGVLRVPVTTRINLPELSFALHRLLGGVLAAVAIGWVLRSRTTSGWLAALVIVVAVVSGWSAAASSLSPRPAALHATFSAFAALALADVSIRRRVHGGASSMSGILVRPWIRLWARLALGLLLIQVAIGAMLRHQLIAVEWHLLFAGLASVTLLVPAAAVVYGVDAARVIRRAASWAIAAIVTQASLGAAVFVMIQIGPPSATAWLAMTIAHVTGGTLSLLASMTLVQRTSQPETARRAEL